MEIKECVSYVLNPDNPPEEYESWMGTFLLADGVMFVDTRYADIREGTNTDEVVVINTNDSQMVPIDWVMENTDDEDLVTHLLNFKETAFKAIENSKPTVQIFDEEFQEINITKL